MIKLLQATTPKRTVLVGLSIGGLFAAQAIQNGVQAAGLVLINTLRKPGFRLDWINEIPRAFKAEGQELLLDLMASITFSPGKLAKCELMLLKEKISDYSRKGRSFEPDEKCSFRRLGLSMA